MTAPTNSEMRCVLRVTISASSRIATEPLIQLQRRPAAAQPETRRPAGPDRLPPRRPAPAPAPDSRRPRPRAPPAIARSPLRAGWSRAVRSFVRPARMAASTISSSASHCGFCKPAHGQLPGSGIPLRHALGQPGAGALGRRRRIVQLMRETGGELAERRHLLQVAGMLLLLQPRVALFQLLGAQPLGDVAEEGVRGDDLAVDEARGDAALDRNPPAILAS